MIPYLLLILIPFLLGAVELVGQKYNKLYTSSVKQTVSTSEYIGCWICIIVFSIIVGGTDGNGLDWWTSTGGYAKIDYSQISLLDWSQFEGGFVLANQLAGNFHVFIFFMALICIFIVYKIVIRESPYPLVSLTFFILSTALYLFMGVYRHAIAETVVMLAWLCRENRKKQVFIILLGMTFHIAAAVALIYLIIPQRKVLSQKVIIFILGISILFRIAITFLLPLLLPFIGGAVGEKLVYYEATEGFGGSFGFNYFLFRCFIVFIAYLYIDKKDKRQVFYFNTYLLSVAVYIALTISDTFFRLSMFFSISEVVLIPIVIRQIKKRHKYSLVHIVMYLLFSALYFYTYFKQLYESEHFYIPYKSVFYI